MKENVISAIIIVPIVLAFIFISICVWMSNGKNSKLIRTKIKLGAMLLTFTWFANSCDTKPFVTCYDPMPAENSIWIEYQGDSLIFSTNDTMLIQISNPTYNYFSFEILDELKNYQISGILQQPDSLNYGIYKLMVDEKLQIGKYFITFFGENDSVVTKKNKIISYNFQVID